MSLKRLPQALVVLAALTATIVVPQASATAAAAQIFYGIRGYQSGKCIDNPNSTNANVQMIIWTCNNGVGATNQDWAFDGTDSGYYNVRNRASGKCLTVEGNSSYDNARVIQYACNTGDNEEWVTVNATIVNRHSGLCLTVQGEFTTNGSKLLQFYCNGKANQNWGTEL